MSEVMIDLETFGKRKDAVIVSIGAVKFSSAGVAPGSEFYCVVDPDSCLREGLTVDGSTVMWWLEQSDDARRALTANLRLPLRTALSRFSAWFLLRDAETIEGVWGNGSDFDNVILASAYEACGMEPPWKFYQNRCFRSLRAMFPGVTREGFAGTKHNALDDALSQAEHAAGILRLLETRR